MIGWHSSPMTNGEKESAKRAEWSEFEGIVNPNERTAVVLLGMLLPVAVLGLGFALFSMLFGDLSMMTFMSVIFLVAAFGFSGSK